MSELIPLSQIALGGRARVARVVGTTEQVRRIEEMGLRSGVSLEMVRPGSPCIVRLQGQTLCVRGDESLNVLVCEGAEP